MVKEKDEVKELRLRFVPVDIHKKIEKHIGIRLAEDDVKLTKEGAAIELLNNATKHISIPD